MVFLPRRNSFRFRRVIDDDTGRLGIEPLVAPSDTGAVGDESVPMATASQRRLIPSRPRRPSIVTRWTKPMARDNDNDNNSSSSNTNHTNYGKSKSMRHVVSSTRNIFAGKGNGKGNAILRSWSWSSSSFSSSSSSSSSSFASQSPSPRLPPAKVTGPESRGKKLSCSGTTNYADSLFVLSPALSEQGVATNSSNSSNSSSNSNSNSRSNNESPPTNNMVQFRPPERSSKPSVQTTRTHPTNQGRGSGRTTRVRSGVGVGAPSFSCPHEAKVFALYAAKQQQRQKRRLKQRQQMQKQQQQQQPALLKPSRNRQSSPGIAGKRVATPRKDHAGKADEVVGDTWGFQSSPPMPMSMSMSMSMPPPPPLWDRNATPVISNKRMSGTATTNPTNTNVTKRHRVVV